MDSGPSQGTETPEPSVTFRDLAANFVRYLELRLQLFGVESREIHSSIQKPVKSRADGPLSKLWKEVWKISKPLIATYFVKLWAENAETPESK